MVRKLPPFHSQRKKRSTSEGTPQFPNGISGKLPYHLTSNLNFRIFWPNGKHPNWTPTLQKNETSEISRGLGHGALGRTGSELLGVSLARCVFLLMVLHPCLVQFPFSLKCLTSLSLPDMRETWSTDC